MKVWKKIFLKYFDYNENKKVDWWEVLLTLGILAAFELITGIISNYISAAI